MNKIILTLSLCISFTANAQWTKKTDKTGLCSTQSLNVATVNNIAYIGAGYDSPCKEWYKYDATTDTWTDLPPYPSDYNQQTVCFAINGKAYVGVGVINGMNPECDNKLYEYDVTANTWTLKTTMPGKLRNGCFSFVIGNNAYVGGGVDSMYQNYFTDVYKYDPAANTWTPVAAFPDTISIGAKSFGAGGKGYVMGGIKLSGNISDNGWQYDPANNAWKKVAQIPSSKLFAAAVAVANDVPYICMGMGFGTSKGMKDLYKYSASANTWTFVDSLPDNRTVDAGIGFAANEKLYFGLGGNNVTGSYNPMMWEYKLTTTGITDANVKTHSVTVYPNPSSTYFMLKSDEEMPIKTAVLYSTMGQEVQKWESLAVNTPVYYNQVQPGNYFLKIKNDKGQGNVLKVIVANN